MIKLPVLKTTIETWYFIWQERTDLFFLAAPFVVAMSLISAVLGWLIPPIDLAESPNSGATLVIAFQLTLTLIVTTLFSVTWHRRYLVPLETLTVKATLGWSQRHWRFLRAMAVLFGVYMALAMLLVILSPILFSLLLPTGDGSVESVQPFIMAFALPILIYVSARLCLLFPAAAVEETLPLTKCWQRTRGNGLRIVFVYLLTNLPLILVATIIARILRIPSLDFSITFLFLSTLIQNFVYYFSIAVGVSALSHIYKTLSKGPGTQLNLTV